MNIRITALLMLFLASVSIHSQEDKLRILWEQTGAEFSDSVRIRALADLGFQHVQINLDSSDYYRIVLQEFAEKKNDKKGMAMALGLKGAYLVHKRQLKQAHGKIEEAINLADELNDHSILKRIYNVAAMHTYALKDYEKTIQHFYKSLEHTELSGDIAYTPIVHGNLGYAHLQNDNVEQAEYHFDQMLTVADTLNDLRIKSFAVRNVGMLQAKKGELIKAKKNYLESIRISTQQSDLYNEGYTRLMLGKLLFSQKNFIDAKAEYTSALHLFDQLGNIEHRVETYVAILKLHNELQQYDLTISLANEALSLIEQNKSTSVKKTFFEELAEAYAEKGEFKKAYTFHKQYKMWADSVYTLDKENIILEIEAVHQIEKKNISIEQLNSDKVNMLKNRRLTNLISLLSLGMISLLSINLWNNYNRKKSYSETLEIDVKKRTVELEKINNELVSSNSELERFAYITSHDLKEPLRNINSFSELAQRALQSDKSKKAEQNLEYIKTNALQMNTLIEDVLDYSKLKISAEQEQVDLNKVLDDVRNSLSTMILEKDAFIENNTMPILKGSTFQLFQLFKNLIENGIKYNQNRQAIVHIDASETEEAHHISVKDNGIGIDPKYHSDIFTMFKRLHTKAEFSGTGLGLATVRKVVHNLNGKIDLKSSLDQGSEFIISIPK